MEGPSSSLLDVGVMEDLSSSPVDVGVMEGSSSSLVGNIGVMEGPSLFGDTGVTEGPSSPPVGDVWVPLCLKRWGSVWWLSRFPQSAHFWGGGGRPSSSPPSSSSSWLQECRQLSLAPPPAEFSCRHCLPNSPPQEQQLARTWQGVGTALQHCGVTSRGAEGHNWGTQGTCGSCPLAASSHLRALWSTVRRGSSCSGE